MTQQEIQDRNKEIALMLSLKPLIKPYLGAYQPTSDTTNPSFYNDRMEGESWYVYPEYDSDWNWLMEAVEFIQKELIKNNDEFCIEFYEGLPGEPMTFVSYAEQNVESKSSKEAVFIAVSDFAKLYNNKEL